MKNLLLLILVFESFCCIGQIQRPIGSNLADVQDYSEEFVFVDVMKQSREWIAHDLQAGADWSSGVDVPLRNDGYPIEIPYDDGVNPPQGVRTLMFFGSLDGVYPSGNYKLKVEGTGTIELWGSASGVYTCPVEIDVAVDNTLGGIGLEILSSDVSDPIHNIRFIMPGFESVYETDPFHPDLLSFLSDFQVIRFMDWMKTNNSIVEEWTDANSIDYYTQTRENGVSYEYMTDIANLLQKDVWINVPHAASDNFVIQFAQFLRDELDPNLKIYLEYSNEVWNGIFEQHTYAGDEGLALGYPGEPWERAWIYTAKRSADVFQIFTDEFVDDARFVKVIPGFSGSDWVTNFIVERFNEVQYNPTQISADALAVAPYFGGSVADNIAAAGQVPTVTVDQILDSLELSLLEAYSSIDASKVVADEHNLDLIAYEGGQHLVAFTPHDQDAVFVGKLLDANRDARMEGIYCDYLNYWYTQTNGGLYTNFSSHGGYNQFGSWGVKENFSDVLSPKYLGLINCAFSYNTITATQDVSVTEDCIVLYPNPVADFFTIQGELASYKVEIYDVNNVLYQDLSGVGSEITIDILSLPAGIYFVKIENVNNNDICLKKIIKE